MPSISSLNLTYKTAKAIKAYSGLEVESLSLSIIASFASCGIEIQKNYQFP